MPEGVGFLLARKFETIPKYGTAHIRARNIDVCIYIYHYI